MAANTKDRRCLNLLSPITFRIFSCFAIPFSQSNTLLNSTKLKAMTIIGSEAEQISWRHMTSSAFLWSFNSFPVSREKALLKWPKFKKLFERHICKVCKVNLTIWGPKSVSNHSICALYFQVVCSNREFEPAVSLRGTSAYKFLESLRWSSSP